VSETRRFRTYHIAVKPGSEYQLEAAMHMAGFSAFIVADGEEWATLEEIERKHAPSTANFQTEKERSA
jgi:hypothetical protein